MEKIAYKTIERNNLYEIEKIKGSRFIGSIFKTESKEEAEEQLEMIRKKNYSATHNCFAYTVGIDQPVTRFSDDGEPSGTAGRPMMNVLESSGLSNVLLVVTRYYGGTKLGTGGLMKAYSEAAKEVISNSKIIDVEIKISVEFDYVYDSTSMIMNLINKYEAEIVEEKYGDQVSMRIMLNKAFLESFSDEIFDKSNGKIKTRDI
ncbi:MAG: YigZ family protein [Candidatus Delongbacteria bacterium]|nr:YigZ family protein [Candidatus Delongbacteria bacterium]